MTLKCQQAKKLQLSLIAYVIQRELDKTEAVKW